VLRIGSTVLGVNDVARAVAFWEAALGYRRREEPDETWAVLVPPMGAAPQLALARSETPVQAHPRIHLDLYASDREAEIARLVGLGATRADWDLYGEDADFVVLEDPDGNRFCVIEKPAGWIGFAPSGTGEDSGAP
jgi:catechol 2,3-dioxygenase-like lactoylglutathione lyase family enzyme